MYYQAGIEVRVIIVDCENFRRRIFLNSIIQRGVNADYFSKQTITHKYVSRCYCCYKLSLLLLATHDCK